MSLVNGKIKMWEKLQIKMYINVHKNGILLLVIGLGKGGEGYRRWKSWKIIMGFLCMNFQIDVICYRSDNDKTILKILFDKIKGNDGKYLSTSIPY